MPPKQCSQRPQQPHSSQSKVVLSPSLTWHMRSHSRFLGAETCQRLYSAPGSLPPLNPGDPSMLSLLPSLPAPSPWLVRKAQIRQVPLAPPSKYYLKSDCFSPPWPLPINNLSCLTCGCLLTGLPSITCVQHGYFSTAHKSDPLRQVRSPPAYSSALGANPKPHHTAL